MNVEQLTAGNDIPDPSPPPVPIEGPHRTSAEIRSLFEMMESGQMTEEIADRELGKRKRVEPMPDQLDESMASLKLNVGSVADVRLNDPRQLIADYSHVRFVFAEPDRNRNWQTTRSLSPARSPPMVPPIRSGRPVRLRPPPRSEPQSRSSVIVWPVSYKQREVRINQWLATMDRSFCRPMRSATPRSARLGN